MTQRWRVHKRPRGAIAAPALLALLALLAGCQTPTVTQRDPVIEIVLEKSNDTALVEYRPGLAILTVRSASGIGGLRAGLAEGAWPDEVRVRLHLSGLERLELGYGPYLLATGVSSTSDPAPAPTLYTRGEDDRVTETAATTEPYQMPIELHSKTQDPPAIPLQDGYFEISLPPHFFSSSEPGFTLQWVDFYR